MVSRGILPPSPRPSPPGVPGGEGVTRNGLLERGHCEKRRIPNGFHQPTLAPYNGIYSPQPSPSWRQLMAAASPLQSLVAAGTKLWLDSVDPQEVAINRALG